eukprot:952708-Amphidinium_carterae.1
MHKMRKNCTKNSTINAKLTETFNPPKLRPFRCFTTNGNFLVQAPSKKLISESIQTSGDKVEPQREPDDLEGGETTYQEV